MLSMNLPTTTILYLLRRASEMKTITHKPLKDRIMSSLFYEPSTRTSCSFQAAMLRLGGSVISLPVDQSSVQKGETLQDTIRTLCCYSDIIVLRHPAKGAALEAASVSTKPILNAGDGTGEHPSQALLDLFTIQQELGRLKNLTITFMGDLTHGRTVHSLVRSLVHFPNITILYASSFPMPPDIVEYVATFGLEQRVTTLDEALPETDVLYVTRIQKERFTFEGTPEIICAERMKRAKKNMIVMHPLPRNEELSTDMDEDPRSVYFKQMEHGMYMRMAILEYYLSLDYDKTCT
jgi:aspartate carbamoyltransferase